MLSLHLLLILFSILNIVYNILHYHHHIPSSLFDMASSSSDQPSTTTLYLALVLYHIAPKICHSFAPYHYYTATSCQICLHRGSDTVWRNLSRSACGALALGIDDPGIIVFSSKGYIAVVNPRCEESKEWPEKIWEYMVCSIPISTVTQCWL